MLCDFQSSVLVHLLLDLSFFSLMVLKFLEMVLFFIFISTCFLQVCRNTVDFCILTLNPVALLNY